MLNEQIVIFTTAIQTKLKNSRKRLNIQKKKVNAARTTPNNKNNYISWIDKYLGVLIGEQ